ncbi:hypothetical protein I8J29_11435 [Paenibacillus sp. MWE-103]|uniref:Alpha-mannosidase n=1 Tax=Paenibacillus artemisiicola TaxID=1172618 RepID=A0ABS3W940_9BACL|nr:hypothetical protein [Paenibacillus artemisiicola]MBO7744813.1 hypothetical protein [Paenibacillus artemisiicola]
MTDAQQLRLLRYGSPDPLPERHALRAGPLTAVFEEGGLRYIRFGDVEIVRGLYAAVRDRDWGTVRPAFRNVEIAQDADSFRVRFTAEHRRGDIDFTWEGVIDGSAEGTIAFSFDGAAHAAFLKNRIGFCVLHPAALAGTPVETETPEGTVVGAFPERISPHQSFRELRAIRHEVRRGLTAELRFDGDLFEMEDQRNWTDDSYKTYCTPLALPYPAAVHAGDRIRQTVTLRLIGDRAPSGRTQAAADAPHVELLDRPAGRLPRIGLGSAPGRELEPLEAEKLRLLRPAFLHATVRLGEPDWQAELDAAARNARQLDCGLELEALLPDGADDGERAAERLVGAIASGRLRVDAVYPYRVSAYVADEALLALLAALRSAAGVTFRVGGGTRAYFAEFNRAALPLAAMEAATFALNPQVHAFDAASMAEAASAQGAAVRSARAIAPGVPLAVGPITLKPRLNPNASSPEAAAAAENRANREDARQRSLFGAGWTLGSLKSLAEASADRACYYETAGTLGLLPEGGAGEYPLYHVLACAGALQGEITEACLVRDRLSYEALAVRDADGRRTLLLANYTDAPLRLRVRAPSFRPGRLRLLDDRGLPCAGAGETAGPYPRLADAPPPDVLDGSFELELRPFAFAVAEEE